MKCRALRIEPVDVEGQLSCTDEVVKSADGDVQCDVEG